MKTYFYKKADGSVVHIECEGMFWGATACVFVKNSYASVVISLQPGEIVWEAGATTEVVADTQSEHRNQQPA